jgi:hypothetical protein
MSDKKKTKQKKSVAKWLLVGIVVIGVFMGFNYFKSQKLRRQNFEAMEEQRQVLIEGWEEQGFTEAEIAEKLESMRPARSIDGDHQPGDGPGVMRMITGGGRRK